MRVFRGLPDLPSSVDVAASCCFKRMKSMQVCGERRDLSHASRRTGWQKSSQYKKKPTPLRDPGDPPASSQPRAPRPSNFLQPPLRSDGQRSLQTTHPATTDLERRCFAKRALEQALPFRQEDIEKTGSPDLLLAKRAGCIRGTTSSTARRRGRQYCFRGFNCGSCVAVPDFFPMERNGRDCWRSARSWHEIFSPLRYVAAVRVMRVDCSSCRKY